MKGSPRLIAAGKDEFWRLPVIPESERVDVEDGAAFVSSRREGTAVNLLACVPNSRNTQLISTMVASGVNRVKRYNTATNKQMKEGVRYDI